MLEYLKDVYKENGILKKYGTYYILFLSSQQKSNVFNSKNNSEAQIEFSKMILNQDTM
jgi:hypothetical protein